MISITVFHGSRHLTYQSDIAPNVGDIYAANNLFDEHQYTVTERLLSAKTEAIVLHVEYSFPLWVAKQKLDDTERDLLTQENLS